MGNRTEALEMLRVSKWNDFLLKGNDEVEKNFIAKGYKENALTGKRDPISYNTSKISGYADALENVQQPTNNYGG